MSLQKYSSAEVGLDHLYEISRIVTETSEWKPALNEIVSLVRTIFIFDNLVVYLADPARHDLDVMYARAMGRGRSAEADIAWGEIIANQIMDDPKTVLQEPVNDPSINRLERPFILGIPLRVSTRTLGAIVFIRFGSPPFEDREHFGLDIHGDYASAVSDKPCQFQGEESHSGSGFQSDHSLTNIRTEDFRGVLEKASERTGQEIPQPPRANSFMLHVDSLLKLVRRLCIPSYRKFWRRVAR